MKKQEDFHREVTEFVRDALSSIPMQLRRYQQRCLVAIPIYVQEIIHSGIRNEYGFVSPYFTVKDGETFLDGWKIVPGYEPAIVAFIPAAVEIPEYVFKIPLEVYIDNTGKQNKTSCEPKKEVKKPLKIPIVAYNYSDIIAYCKAEKIISESAFNSAYFWAKDIESVRGREFDQYVILQDAHLLKDYDEIIASIKNRMINSDPII